MLLTNWGDVFVASLQSLWIGVVSFIPSLIVAILIFIVGWIVGKLVGNAVSQLISALKIDKALSSTGLNEISQRSGLNITASGLLGGLVKWFVVIVFLMTSLEIIGLTEVNGFLRDVVLGYLPNVIIAALVLLAATVISDFMERVVVGGAKAARVRSAHMLGSVTKYAIWVFAFIIVLSELGVAVQFMQILFTGIIAMLAIAGGLAFGLGGRDAAARAIESVKNDMMR
ncbi:hypothetical protein KC842_03175 [Candidatus Nomurabacteria bacterium]|nr:hypothetical protein [Candidatus Nomurabacteria bacterium]USN94554.1 MAG: hypothetical protein H6791_02225 [Candidatus Nomurabacteria bacterium]